MQTNNDATDNISLNTTLLCLKVKIFFSNVKNYHKFQVQIIDGN